MMVERITPILCGAGRAAGAISMIYRDEQLVDVSCSMQQIGVKYMSTDDVAGSNPVVSTSMKAKRDGRMACVDIV